MKPAVFKIRLDTYEKVQNFTNSIKDLPINMDLYSDRYDVDAKSLLGIISLDLTRLLRLKVYTEDKEALKTLEEICANYK